MMLDKFGRITLPKAVRDHLGITPNTLLEIEEKEDSVIIRVADKKSYTTLEHGILVYTGVALGDLDQTLEDIRNERLKDI